jgi:hypothetical protein
MTTPATYQELRKPTWNETYSTMNPPMTARHAMSVIKRREEMAKEARRFERLEAMGLVKVEVEPEPECYYWEDLEGDTFNPEANPDINPNVLKREQKAYRERVEREGVWCLVGYVKTNDGWESVTSLGMIDSYDYAEESRNEMFYECIKHARDYIRNRCRCCKGTGAQ